MSVVPAGQGVGCVTQRPVRAAHRVGTKPSRRRRRGVAQESTDGREQITAVEESTEDLIVDRVEPLAAHFDGVASGDHRQVVLDLRPPEQLVDRRVQEVRIAETKRGVAHSRVGRNVGGDGVTRPQFPCVCDMELVELARRERREEIQVEDVDFRGTLDAIGGIPVRGHVEGLVLVLGVVEVVGCAQVVRRVEHDIHLSQDGRVVDRVVDGIPLFLIAGGAEEIEQRAALAFGTAVDQRFMRRVGNHRHIDAARAERLAQIGPLELLVDVLERDEVEHPVALDRPPQRSPELLAMEIGRRCAIRRVGGQSLQTLEMENAAVQVIGSRLRDDIDDAPGRAAELRVGAAGHDLEFLHRLQRDVDGGALSAQLLAEEAIVVVAAIEADVVVHASLSAERDLVAIGALHDADSGSEREQIFELPAQDGRRADGRLIERVAHFGAGDVNQCGARHGHGLGSSRDLQHGVQRRRLSNRDGDILLDVRGKALQGDRDGIGARAKLEKHEASITTRRLRAQRIGVDIPDLDERAWDQRAGLIRDGALNDAGRNLRLAPCRHSDSKDKPEDDDDTFRHWWRLQRGGQIETAPTGECQSGSYTRGQRRTQATSPRRRLRARSTRHVVRAQQDLRSPG